MYICLIELYCNILLVKCDVLYSRSLPHRLGRVARSCLGMRERRGV
jgi:hypothetical protein